jgi:hypothetical protein
MYFNNFVVSLKVDGKFLRENNEKVNLPFNSEYSIYLKNMSGQKATVLIEIDGKNVLDGNRVVISPNSAIDLQGFMDGNEVKNKFRFIKRTEDIENFRGINPEDSLIAVHFQFEKIQPEPIIYPYVYSPYYWWTYPNPPYTVTISSTWNNNAYGNNNVIYRSYNNNTGGSNSSPQIFNNQSLPAQDFNSMRYNDAGITVKGNDISQQFYPTYIGQLEDQSSTIVLKLVGFDKDNNDKPIFVKDKITCPTCGKVNRSSNKFCVGCGTRLLGE